MKLLRHRSHKKARKILRALSHNNNTILSEDFGVGAPKFNYNPADSGFSQLIDLLSTWPQIAVKLLQDR